MAEKLKKVAEADGTPVKEEVQGVQKNDAVGAPEEFGLTNEDVAKLAAEKAAEISAEDNADVEEFTKPVVAKSADKFEVSEAVIEERVEQRVIRTVTDSRFEGPQRSLHEANLEARRRDRESRDLIEELAENAKEAILASGGRVTAKRLRKPLRPVPIAPEDRPKQ